MAQLSGATGPAASPSPSQHLGSVPAGSAPGMIKVVVLSHYVGDVFR